MAKGGPVRKIPIDDINRHLTYCPDTGLFKRNGSIAGYKNIQGYIIIGVGGVQYRAHRIAWAITHGDTSLDIDHIDGDTTNNRISNLRIATEAENSQNMRKHHVDSITKHIGVHINKNNVKKKYRAAITLNGKMIRKDFLTLEEASDFYKQKKREIHPFSTI